MTDRVEDRNDNDGYLQVNASAVDGDFPIVMITQPEVFSSIHKEISAQSKDSDW